MAALAFLYPGQGSQKVGMGAELISAEPELLEGYLAQAEAAAGLPIRRYMQEGPMDQLTRTDVAQPALFCVSLAVTHAARARGLYPDLVAGHSLGEYTAATGAGSLSVEDGIELVCLRGRLMAEIQNERPGAMAAVIGLGAEDLAALCEAAADGEALSLANINSPTQIVVSGEEPAVERLMEMATEAGAQRVVRLQVGAAFHSALMEPAQAKMREALAGVAVEDPSVPMAANARGELVRTGEEVRDALVAQIASPVRFVECVRALADAGATTFLELGPGRVLANLVRQIEPDADTFSADSPDRLAEFAGERPTFVRA
jgi:[acyl-carrier-protein] S-malonyltransferase